jgi:UDP-glucose 4-epimerase
VDAAGKVINICSGVETSLLDLIEQLSGVYQREIKPDFDEPRSGDIYRSLGDPGLAREVLGFSPEFMIKDGLENTAAWIRKKR